MNKIVFFFSVYAFLDENKELSKAGKYYTLITNHSVFVKN